MTGRWVVFLILGVLLVGCSEPEAQASGSELALTPSALATLDEAHTGLAAYYCRRVVCAGDDGQNHTVQGFVAFDLGRLRELGSFQASLRLYQGEASRAYARLGRLFIERIRVEGPQDPTALKAPALFTLSNAASGEGYLELDVTAALQEALAEGEASLQFRLRFEKPTDRNHQSDLALFGATEGHSPLLIIRPGP
ncbi:hypothetical protein [Meiothermus sp. CFH 77666]|uniref:hypothetical protein n=1 Tax=Meiothermus sp. CFH 77666 TaxID=2817942 RepID=UPI001AA0570C|nr:hypothetical protein [Meiothermus sp. CFH 77666]MBO1436951.1 hypothetical protein [Meiothermus sp. CFH 77666]